MHPSLHWRSLNVHHAKRAWPAPSQAHQHQHGSCVCVLSTAYARDYAKHIINNSFCPKPPGCFPFYWWGGWGLERAINFLAVNNLQKENSHSSLRTKPILLMYVMPPSKGLGTLGYKDPYTPDFLMPFCLQSCTHQNTYWALLIYRELC